MAEPDINNPQGAPAGVRWRDEILQLMYWMTGEGFGREFAVADLQKFLPADTDVLAENLGLLAAAGLVERAGERYALTDEGRREGGRRFADEFEEMLRPGHFECDEPDCDCHDPESADGICKHLSPLM
jgi:hypothetical protein